MISNGIMLHRQMLLDLWWDESGQDLMEFALVAFLLSLCAVATLKVFASDVTALWQSLSSGISSAI